MSKELVATFIGKYDIKCPKCGEVEHLSTYAIAQLSSRNDLRFTCKCGAVMNLLVEDFNNYTNEQD